MESVFDVEELEVMLSALGEIPHNGDDEVFIPESDPVIRGLMLSLPMILKSAIHYARNAVT
jgi:hypothetical protein